MAYTKYPIRPIARQLMLAALSWLMVAAVQAQSLVPLRDMVHVTSTGASHTCGLTVSGGVKCWGANNAGQIGDGSMNQSDLPIDVYGLSSGVMAMSGGGQGGGSYGHTCAVTSGGGVKCWGYNQYGQLGDGGVVNRLIPTDVSDLGSGVLAISAGGFHTCALTTSGGVKCWGRNNRGQLGDGSEIDRLYPTDVDGLESGVVAISTGDQHTCALTMTGGVKCWGANDVGSLGDGSNISRPVPVDVVNLDSGVAEISAGYGHTCARTNSGTAKCWGYNDEGQIGDGTSTWRYVPTDISDLDNTVIAIRAGFLHTCALTIGGGVKCWGNNIAGQLGDGTTTRRRAPTDVSNLGGGVAMISPGQFHTCALATSGGIKCWGDNASGQIGNGRVANRHLVPTDVLRLSTRPAELWIRIERLSDSVTKRGVETRQYRIEALNLGSEAASATQVTAVLSGLSNIQWTCDAPTGCTPAEGMSPVSSQFDLASGELVRVTLEGEVLPDVAFIDLAAQVSTSSGGGAQARHGLSETANGIGVLKDGFE